MYRVHKFHATMNMSIIIKWFLKNASVTSIMKGIKKASYKSQVHIEFANILNMISYKYTYTCIYMQ